MITASHNPADYNGYKVFWGNGAQIVAPHDRGIADATAALGPLASIAQLPEVVARNRKLLKAVPEALTERYLAGVRALGVHPEGPSDLAVVYTALHGVGNKLATAALGRFRKVVTVPEQAEPDAGFPTVAFPNPEEKGVLDLALALGRKEGADLVLANDPDADRLAAAVRRGDDWVQLTGNEVGILLGHYLLTEGEGGDRLVATSIVSSPLLGQMARALGVRFEETLTGFKWLANRAIEVERATGARLVFAYEEALGYSVGTLVRDKDGIGTAYVLAELAARLKAEGRTLLHQLEAIYRKYGYYVSAQHSVTLTGPDGLRSIADTMTGLRRRPPKTMGGRRVLAVRDYLQRTRTEGDKTETLALPPADVLAFEFGAGSRVMLRPSGTEPKIKYYFDVAETLDAKESFETGEKRARAGLAELRDDFMALVTERGGGA